jgi:uncharacterized iron-regulated membrane protein
MKRYRKAWLAVHRWLGLAVMIPIVIASLSGSFLVFYKEIDRILNPELAATQGVGQPVPMRDVLASAQTHLNGRFLHSVFPSEGGDDVHHVWLTPSRNNDSRMWEVLVDPFTARVLGEREAVPTIDFSRRNIANTIYTLHFQLFMGATGSIIVGLVGIVLLVSGASGIVLWWPRNGRWRPSLSIKRGARGFRLNFDLHRMAGAYSVLVLLLVAFTGVILTFPDEISPLLRLGATPSATWQAPDVEIVEAREVDADAVMQEALRQVPGGRITCLWMPGASGAAWRVSLNEDGAVGGKSEIYIHPASGQVLHAQRSGSSTAEEVFFAWQLPLHNGSAFGIVGRMATCIAGLVPLLLAITGTLIYLRKRRSRRTRQET